LILIILFSIFLSSAFKLGNDLDKYSCQFPALLKEFVNNRDNNDSLAMNQTFERMKTMGVVFEEDVNNFKKITPLIGFFRAIDPFVPIPCEYSPSNFCRFYMSQDSYLCNKGIFEYPLPFIDSIFTLEMKDYKTPSFWLILLNFIYLIVLGYLVSCAIFFFFRRKEK